MFNARTLVIDAFVEQLQIAYRRNYGTLEPGHGEILGWAARTALEHISGTTALYHNLEHTLMVTLVGQEMLRGKHMREGGIGPNDWLNAVIALLCHDIGYVHGVCRADVPGRAATGVGDGMLELAHGATDASLTPHHVARGKLFIRERFDGHPIIDADAICDAIELTTFPGPDSDAPLSDGDLRCLVRAADLIGQLADPDYLRKLPALFQEFAETGQAKRIGYANPGDLREGYPTFYWNRVHPFVAPQLRYLELTQEGRQWIANLRSHLFEVEHDADD